MMKKITVRNGKTNRAKVIIVIDLHISLRVGANSKHASTNATSDGRIRDGLDNKRATTTCNLFKSGGSFIQKGESDDIISFNNTLFSDGGRGLSEWAGIKSTLSQGAV